jgi:hypothetical protein
MDISDTLSVANREEWRKWLEENYGTAENFQRYSGAYQRIRIAFIDVARERPEEFEKRLGHFIRMTEQDKQYGFGTEEYY